MPRIAKPKAPKVSDTRPAAEYRIVKRGETFVCTCPNCAACGTKTNELRTSYACDLLGCRVGRRGTCKYAALPVVEASPVVETQAQAPATSAE